jgi:hypothetical protein
MNRLIEYTKSILFRLNWIFMSPRGRYAFLWARTSKLGDLSLEYCGENQ